MADINPVISPELLDENIVKLDSNNEKSQILKSIKNHM